jgi:tetratricopeptide (TPR) repeat protein
MCGYPTPIRHPMQTPLEAALAHHRAGRLDEAAVLYRRSLEAQPDCAVAWNMLGNVEYQRDHVDDALHLIGKAIELDPTTPAFRITLGHVYRRSGNLENACLCYSKALDLAPDSALAATSLADALRRRGELSEAVVVLQAMLCRHADHLEALASLGNLWLALERPDAAALAFRRVLDIDPRSAEALFGLGVAVGQQGSETLAIQCFENAISLKPDFSEALYNLGVVAAQHQRLDSAESWFRRAIAAHPEYVDAHINLSAVLLKTGRPAQAREHREFAYRRKCVFVRTSRTALRTALILFDAGRGNINLSHLFSRTHNIVIDWMIEYAEKGQATTLPPFDLVFNAMGDADMAGAASLPASEFIADCGKPVFNRPEVVALTSREKLPALLEGIEGLFVPKAWRISPDAPWPEESGEQLPVLVRPVDSHGGEGLQYVADRAELGRIAAQSSQPLHVSRFCDFRSNDGWFRKYRVVFVDRQPFPYHLAISAHWLVHYATADMEDHAWKLEEERRFLEHPQEAIGAAGLAAIAAIGARMDLDFAGIDFSVLRDGRILVFEANPVMFVHPVDADGVLGFKSPYVTRIFAAFEAMLSRSVRLDALA